MKEAATILSGEARRAASIFHQTPGWRWRRELCLTERSQQRQSGPTTNAWIHDRCNRVDSDACRRGNVTTCARETVKTPARSSARDRRETLAGEATLWRVRVAPPGHVRAAPPEPHRSWNRSERDPRGCGQRWRDFGRQQSCTARRHAGSTARKRAPSGRVWSATLKLDGPIVLYCQSTTTEGCHGTKLDRDTM